MPVLLVALLIAACGGHTTGATNVTATTAQLNAVGHCDSADNGRVFWEYRPTSTGSWVRHYQNGDGRVLPASGSKVDTTNCGSRVPSSGDLNVTDSIEGLTPGTTYEYRIGFRYSNGSEVVTDSSGTNGGTNYDTFQTTACTDTQGTTQTAQQFVDEAGNQNGTATAPAVLCLRGGSQNLTGSSELKPHANQYIKGVSAGTVLNGNIEITPTNTHVTLEDFKIVGCFLSCPSGVASINKAIHAHANDAHLRYLDISQSGGLNNDAQNCLIVGSNTEKVTGFELTNSLSHDCGRDADDNHDHGIYCQSATGAQIIGNWFYRNEGFGIQIYPDCDNALFEGNMVANNGWSITLAGEGSAHSDNAQFKYGVAGYSYQTSGANAPISCYMPGTGSTTLDYVLYDPNYSGTTDCGSSLAQTNTLNASPVFENFAGNDLNVTGTSAKEHVGLKYAENVPGPSY